MAVLPSDAYYALVEVFVFLAFAELVHSFAEKVGLPDIVADLVLGMALSGFALGGLLNALLGVPLFGISPYLLLFADFSVILLLFAAGLGGGFQGLRRAGWPAVGAAIAGDVLPFAVVAFLFSRIYDLDAALLLGVAAAATSSAVVASVTQRERIAKTDAGQFLMNVAALDDVVALILLSVVLTIVGGQFDVISVTGSVAESVVAWVVLLLASVVVIPRVLKVPRVRELRGMPFLILFVLVAIVIALGFSAVIGAFIAGLAIAESIAADRTREITEVLLLVFGALFFVVTGAQFDVGELTNLALVGLGLLLATLAAAGKVLGVYPFARLRLGPSPASGAVAVGMVPRGEIGLIVGSIGLSLGVFDQTMLGEVLLMSLATTLAGAYFVRRLAGTFGAPPTAPAAAPDPAPTVPS